MTEDEIVGWHNQLNGHKFEQALGVSDGQRSLACCSPGGRKELDTTERLNKNSKQSSEAWVREKIHSGDQQRSLILRSGF